MRESIVPPAFYRALSTTFQALSNGKDSPKLVDSMSPKSDAQPSIEQLVMEAEDLVIIRRRPNRTVSSAKTQQSQASESENDHHDYDDTVEGMDCRRDVYRRSMQSSSSMSHLLDSLIVQPENEGNEEMLSEIDVDVVDAMRHRRQLFTAEDRSSNDGSQFSVDEHDDEEDEEEEEGEEVDGQLSEFWDQVSKHKHGYTCTVWI